MSDGFFISDHRHHYPINKDNLFQSLHETHNQDPTSLTHHFSRSVSLQEPLFNFKVSPEPPFSPEPSPPPSDEDAWNMIYAAAGQVARMKMRMNIISGDTGFVAENNKRGVVGGLWRISDGEELFRQQHTCRNRCVAAWVPPRVHNQCYQQNKLNKQKSGVVGGFGGGWDGGATVVKRECAGTGVFLPRRYCNQPEIRKRQACPPTNLPARMIKSSTAPPQIQPHIYEMLMSHRKAMNSAAPTQQRRRSNIHGGGVIDNPEVLLPQEWTY